MAPLSNCASISTNVSTSFGSEKRGRKASADIARYSADAEAARARVTVAADGLPAFVAVFIVSNIMEDGVAARKHDMSERKRKGDDSSAAREKSAPQGRPLASPGDDVGAAEMGRRVAEHLRERRRAKGMSLDDLARASGVSRAALSQIETHKSNP